MEIEIVKLTDRSLLDLAVQFVFGRKVRSPLAKWYASGHTPSRTQLFAIFSRDTPYSVCMQMRTHDKNGALFLIEPGRPDTGTERAKNVVGNYRDQPRNMFVLCNAQHLIDWSHRRMCRKAELPTRMWFCGLQNKLKEVDKELARNLMPLCEYRNGMCSEFHPCGHCEKGK